MNEQEKKPKVEGKKPHKYQKWIYKIKFVLIVQIN